MIAKKNNLNNTKHSKNENWNVSPPALPHHYLPNYFVLSFLRNLILGFPGGSDGKESAYNAGDLGSIPGLGSSHREENRNPLQYSSWRIPWTEEPGELQSMGSQRVRHNWATKNKNKQNWPIHFSGENLSIPTFVVLKLQYWKSISLEICHPPGCPS